MSQSAFSVEIQRGQRERLRITMDHRGRVDLRVLSLVSVSSGCWSPTAEGVRFTLDDLPEVIAALKALSRAGVENG
jgi:hypothetical protein